MLIIFLVLYLSRVRGDSYLEAYQESHGTTVSEREYSEPYPYPQPQPQPQPEYQYGPPKYQYGPPAHNYGPPAPAPAMFVPSAPSYGPPAPVYGPPAPPPIYGMPHGICFVAVLCLLLFIPHLKHKVDEAVPDGGDDDDEDPVMRQFGNGKQKNDAFLDNITQFVVGAIDNFSKNYTNSDNCDSVYCKTQKIVQGIDNKLSYRKLAEVYSKEIQS